MAYAALVSLAQTITQILNRDLLSSTRYRKQLLASIRKNVILLQDFLDNFPQKSNENLEARITDIANQAEDTIEHIIYRVKETRFQAFFKYIFYRSESRKPLSQSKVEIDSLALEVMSIKLSIIKLGKNDSAAAVDGSSSRTEPSQKRDAFLVGFEDDLLAIKLRLCGESSRLQVIPIVGMGGIGKTTLARNAYHDPLITYHFQIHAWVTVSQDYSPEKIVSDLLSCIKKIKTERLGQSKEEEVRKTLKSGRYLIVMDDMWSTEAWDYVGRMFPDDNNGSRVMLTTRLSDVAAYANSCSHLHEMNLMDEHQSWNLLRHKVFAHGDSPPELEGIGKEIARRCRGLPLAIVVIAGLLSPDSNTKALWEEIAEDVQSTIATKDEQFEKIMSVSYTHLPHRLRACFLYMGVFPEDYEIRVSKLVKLWVAENFLKPSESKSLEETGEEYLEDLVRRNLVLVSKRKCNGKIKSCSIHDLMRKLCIRKSEQERFFVHVMDKHGTKRRNIENQRRVCINQRAQIFPADASSGLTMIRTMIIFYMHVESLQDYLRNCRLLRVLDVVYASREVFAYAQVFQLFHLRYLTLDHRVKIPSGLSNLENLQTIIIDAGKLPCSVRLPMEIWSMRQLRHLGCLCFGPLPIPNKGATCVLENLQTLSVVRDLVCAESTLKMIPNLKKLGIYYSIGKDDEDYHLENLVHLRKLEKLKVINDYYSNSNKFLRPSFPIMLKNLTLRGQGLSWGDIMRIVGSLPNLQVLRLRASHFSDGGKWETSEGEFPKLKYLLIDSSNLECWIMESSDFPSLKWLLLHHCRNLVEIPDGIGDIATLELIEVEGCRTALAESAKRIEKEQRDYYGSDECALQVRCVGCW